MPSKPTTVTLTDNNQLVLPRRISRKAGFKAGDELEVKAIGGIVTLISKPPVTDEEEYTPQQRSIIDAQIAKGLEDVKRGRLHGPFETHQEMIRFLHGRVRKAPRKQTPRKTR